MREYSYVWLILDANDVDGAVDKYSHCQTSRPPPTHGPFPRLTSDVGSTICVSVRVNTPDECERICVPAGVHGEARRRQGKCGWTW